MSQRTEALAHDWYYGVNNRQGSPVRHVTANGYVQMSYEYDKIWTYNVTLAMKDDELKKVLINGQTYSNTSDEHLRQVTSACPYRGSPFIYLYHGLDYLSLEDEVQSAIRKVDTILKKQLRARSRYYLDEIPLIVDNIERLQSYLKNKDRVHYKYNKPLRKNHKLLNKLRKLAETGKNLESVKDYTSIIEAQKRKAERDRKKLFKAQLDMATKRHLEWYSDSETIPTKLTQDFIGVYLKIVGDTLHTSNRVSVPLKGAKLLYKRWVSGKDIKGLTLGVYTVVSATKSKVQIGCTTINAEELHKVLGDSTK